MNQNFIRTSDAETRNTLLTLGFQLIDSNNNIYTFLNDAKKMSFDESIDKSKIQYTNMLCI